MRFIDLHKHLLVKNQLKPYGKLKKIKKIIGWKKPAVVLIKGKSQVYTWRQWHYDMAKKYPVQYFLLEKLPEVYQSCKLTCLKGINELYDVLISRQHLLDLRQPKDSPRLHRYRSGYLYDEEKVFFALYNIFLQFFKKEFNNINDVNSRIIDYTLHVVDTSSSTSNDDKYQKYRYYLLIKELYFWWHEDRIKLLNEIEENIYNSNQTIVNELSEKLKDQMIDKEHKIIEVFNLYSKY